MDSTEPSSQRRFDMKFIFVMLLCFGGALGSAYMLYSDFTASGGKGKGKPMAKVVRTESSVRRKPSNTYIWANVQENEDLYKKDAIQTSSGSAASIKLADGSVIEMGENSLIIIDDLKDMSLNFLRGQMVVRSASGGASKVSVGSDGKAKLEKLAVRLIAPESLDRIFFVNDKSTIVDFNWALQTEKELHGLNLQVSKDKTFSAKNTYVFKAPERQHQAFRIRTKLPEGTYYWRVVGENEPQSETRQFHIIEAPILKAISPGQSKRFYVFNDESIVQFRWSTPRFAASSQIDQWGEHFIEIAKDRDFKHTIKREKVAGSGGVASFKGLIDGKYFWRIHSKYPNLEVNSTTEDFILERTTKLVFELNQPEENAIASIGSPIRFSWLIEAQNLDFVWQLETKDGKLVEEQKTKAFVAVWKEPTPGHFRWKVQAFVENQLVGETGWRNLSVYLGKKLSLSTPALNEKIFFWKEPKEFKFQWEKDSSVGKDGYYYQFELSKDPEFSSIAVRAKLKEPELESRKFKMTAGEFFWRVNVYDKNNQIVRKSDPKKFSYGLHPPLRSPSSVSPAPGSKVNLLELEGDLIASWEPVEQAVQYEVTVKQVDPKLGTEKVIVKTVTKETSLALKGIKKGKYRWTVKPIDQLGRRGQLDPNQSVPGFSITYGEPLPAPTVISPEVQ